MMARRRALTAKLVVATGVLRPRNPVVLAAKKRKAGPHGPSTKAIRQQEKRRLKKLFEQN
jgi:hypothetical protein